MIFSENFYTQQNLWTKAPLPSETIQKKLFANFWRWRHTHAILKEGIIETIPFSYFEHVKRYLRLTQDPALIHVNQRLKALEAAMQDPNSPEFSDFQKEVHDPTGQRSVILQENLRALSQCFERGNCKSPWVIMLQKITNCFRWCLGLKPLQFYTFASINIDVFKEKPLDHETSHSSEKSIDNESWLSSNSPEFKELIDELKALKEPLISLLSKRASKIQNASSLPPSDPNSLNVAELDELVSSISRGFPELDALIEQLSSRSHESKNVYPQNASQSTPKPTLRRLESLFLQ